MPRSVTVHFFYLRASQPRRQLAKLVMYSGLTAFDIRTTKVGRDVVNSHLFAVSLIYTHASQDSLFAECRTRDRKVASSNPGRSGGRIFCSRVNFVFSYSVSITPPVTAVTRNKPDTNRASFFQTLPY